MPVVYGENVNSAAEIVAALRRHGDAVRGMYRARYVFDANTRDAYAGVQLERPPSLRENAQDSYYPWEQVIIASAACAGSDYPMLAVALNTPIERVEFMVEVVFDPRGEFDGLHGFAAPADAAPCYLSMHLAARLMSAAPRESLERVHAQVLRQNMVLSALRAIPRTDTLEIVAPATTGGWSAVST